MGERRKERRGKGGKRKKNERMSGWWDEYWHMKGGKGCYTGSIENLWRPKPSSRGVS